jgi:hypothetical protein
MDRYHTPDVLFAVLAKRGDFERRAISLLAPVMVCLSCAHGDEFRPSDPSTIKEWETECDAARASVRSEITSQFSACGGDEDCEPANVFTVGQCAVAVNTSFGGSPTERPDPSQPSKGHEALLRVANACWRLGDLMPDCPRRVGVCVQGACRLKTPTPSAEMCQATAASLHTRINQSLSTCDSDGDCQRVGDGYQGIEPLVETKADRDVFRQDVHVLADSCLPVDPSAKPVVWHPACVDSRCVVAEGPAPDSGPAGKGGYRKPTMVQTGCLAGAIRLPSSERPKSQTVFVVKFVVTAEGKPIMFQFIKGKPSANLARAIITGVLSCPWIPGADRNGKSASIWVVQPVRLE